MRNELAERVYPILHHAMDLRERLHRGDRPSFGLEQSTLLGLLGMGGDDPVPAEYGGDVPGVPFSGTAASDHEGTVFLGARYGIVCWLDELFVLDTPWSEQWNEHKLEVSLYASNERAWRFWSQARLAASRGMTDALEVFHLCALLGFRGELRERPEQYAEWFEAANQQIRRSHSRRWDAPPDLASLPRVTVRKGRRQLRNVLTAASLAMSVLVPVVIVFLVRAAG